MFTPGQGQADIPDLNLRGRILAFSEIEMRPEKWIMIVGASFLVILTSYMKVDAQSEHVGEYDPHQIIVKFKPQSRSLMRDTAGRYQINSARAKGIAPLQLDAGQGSRTLAGGIERIFVVGIADGATVEAALAEFGANPDIEYAEPDYIGHGEGSAGGPSAGPQSGTTGSGDPDFSWQWGLKNTGILGGSPGIDINVMPAWQITTGDTNTILAVLDTGIALNHPD
jgi:hypothetical protein